MCNVSGSLVKLECDHWYPKEKFGESTVINAVCLCCNCNPKKNNMPPEEWLCKHFIDNFHTISSKLGMWDLQKKYIIDYVTKLA